MTQLEDQMDKLHERFVYATVREKALQEVNDTTNSRVLGFGILTLIVVLCAGIAQMVYLRTFFKNKKIIWFFHLIYLIHLCFFRNRGGESTGLAFLRVSCIYLK